MCVVMQPTDDGEAMQDVSIVKVATICSCPAAQETNTQHTNEFLISNRQSGIERLRGRIPRFWGEGDVMSGYNCHFLKVTIGIPAGHLIHSP